MTSNTGRLWIVILAICALSCVLASNAVADPTCYLHSRSPQMNVCISDHGNVVQFESPLGIQQIGGNEEGYILCDQTTGVVYHDTGTLESGFGPATIVEPRGLNTFPFAVVRTTTDGRFTMTQHFTLENGTSERQLKMLIDIVNNTSTSHQLALTRYVNADVNGSPANDIYDRTRESLLAWEDASEVGDGANGLALISLESQPDKLPLPPAVEEYPGTRTACNASSLPTPTQGTNLVGTLTHVRTLAPSGTRYGGTDTLHTVVLYHRF
jgi:hypothetical protein